MCYQLNAIKTSDICFARYTYLKLRNAFYVYLHGVAFSISGKHVEKSRENYFGQLHLFALFSGDTVLRNFEEINP